MMRPVVASPGGDVSLPRSAGIRGGSGGQFRGSRSYSGGSPGVRLLHAVEDRVEWDVSCSELDEETRLVAA